MVPKTDFAINRMIYTANETNKLPGTLARSEGGAPSKDANVNEAYEKLEVAYNYYRTHFNEWKSYDGQDSPLIATVHFAEKVGVPYENAYWNGQQLVFGNEYTKATDILGHELTHGVTEHTSGLVMSGQPGALNEAFSDMIGTAIEASETKVINWEMGKGLPTGAFRSLSEPKKFKELSGSGDTHVDPEKLSEWDATCADNLGVHINSTIASHAFYLITKEWIAAGGTIDEVAELFFNAFSTYLSPNSHPRGRSRGGLEGHGCFLRRRLGRIHDRQKCLHHGRPQRHRPADAESMQRSGRVVFAIAPKNEARAEGEGAESGVEKV